jgi:hypothetical protein
MKRMNKKGFSLSAVPQLAIVLVVIAVVLGVGATVLTEVQTTQTADTYAYNATENGLSGVDTLAGWQPTIATIIAAAVVIGIISAYMFFRGR